jgi:hypothetical protein
LMQNWRIHRSRKKGGNPVSPTPSTLRHIRG